jgi:hypothetical protein
MSQGVPYSAAQQDLYFPAKSLQVFPAQQPKSEVELCAWMAWLAYRDQYPDFAFDREGIKQKLDAWGFQPAGFFESRGYERNGGTHCFAAWQDDAGMENRLSVVAFRGTDKDDPTDLLDDAEAPLVDWSGSGKVFAGFSRALQEIATELLPAVRKLDGRLLFTGHSLGAALATLLAGLIVPSALYTIGSPRVGDHDFVASLGSVKRARYVDCCDAVTQLPPALLGYAHLGDALYIDRNRELIENPPDDYVSADRLRARADYLMQYAWKIGNVGVRDLADHAPINYITAIAAAQQ